MLFRGGFEKLELLGGLGVYDFEKEGPRTYFVSVSYFYRGKRAAKTDDLSYAIDYAEIAELLRALAREKHYQLIETVAYLFYSEIKKRFKVIDLVIRIEKPLPLDGLELSFVELGKKTFASEPF